jgi:quinoprotein glucose dehydrogenase
MGVVLLGVGGSLYYAFAGVVLVATGVLLYRGDKRGATLYGAFFSFLPRCFFIR